MPPRSLVYVSIGAQNAACLFPITEILPTLQKPLQCHLSPEASWVLRMQLWWTHEAGSVVRHRLSRARGLSESWSRPSGFWRHVTHDAPEKVLAFLCVSVRMRDHVSGFSETLP